MLLGAMVATDPLLIGAATANMTGGFLVGAVITNADLEATATLTGGTQIAVTVTGQGSADITAAAFLFGEVTETLFPELSPNARAEANDGIKPCLPLLIYINDVSHIGNLNEPDGVTPKLQLYQAFRMASTYTAPPGDRLAVFGASADAIGMRVLTDLQGDGVEEEATLFRRPLENEVVVLLDGTVEKWNATLEAWEAFTTLPQRALLGMRVFELLDPDMIWDYYAKLIGLKYAQLSRDTREILDFIDPDMCPVDQLPLLAENFGVDLLADSSERTQRETIRQWVPLMQIKGLAESVVIALRTLGFSGYATHIWTRPNATATEFIERPFNYSNEFPDVNDPLAFYPSPSVAIHLNELDGTPLVVIDDITKELVATFLKRNILPAHVQIRTFVTDIPVGDDSVEATDAVTVITDTRTAIAQVQAGPATTVFSVSILPVRVTVVAVASPATTSISGDGVAP
jgi:phage tail P2-like protein